MRNSAQRVRLRATIARSRPACYLCGEAIDYQLHWLDPRAFTIDHVVPLTRGGTDTLDNVRAAHRTCNSTKRARVVSPVVRRSGALT